MRYDRQLIMDEIGRAGQEKLKHAVVTVVGCGGLGSPVLTYLTAAGVGTIKIIDCDTVSESNLNRQFLHWESDIGRKKTDSAREKLLSFNPEAEIVACPVYVDEENKDALVRGSDVVVDCVDNIETRLLVNRACLRQNIPLVEGGVSGFFGYVMAVSRESACVECLGYQSVKVVKPVPAFGAAAGVIGSLQAMEAVKILLGRKDVLFGKMLNYDGGAGEFDLVEVEKNPQCEAHKF